MADVPAQVLKAFRSARSIVAVTHVNPDGDGIGAGLGLTRFARKCGKKAAMVISGQVPVQYRWLAKAGELRPYGGPKSAEARLIESADAVFILDLADWRRLGKVEPHVRASRGFKVTVDHHPEHENGSDFYWREIGAAAAGEMAWRLTRAIGKPALPADAAEALYVALMTDTGCFRFSNSDRVAHDMASALIDAGVDVAAVYSKVYESSSPGRLRLLGSVLASMKTACGGRLAWGEIPSGAYKKYGILEEETEGIIDVIRTLKGVEVSILFKETAPRRVRLSLRSRRTVDVNALAKRFDGGGHARAAGATIEGSLPSVVRKVTAAAARAVRFAVS